MTSKIPWRFTHCCQSICALMFSIFNMDHYTATDHAAILCFSLGLWTVMITAAAWGFNSWWRKVVGNKLNAPIENVMDKLEQRNWRSSWKHKVCCWVQRTSSMLNAENLTDILLFFYLLAFHYQLVEGSKW
jgi:hypothetical protein